MSATPAVTFTDLSFSYGAQPVLEGVSQTIEAGDFVGIVGPNGGGKTTLLKLMLGLLKPTRGTLRVLGLDPRRAAQRVGYVPQKWSCGTSVPMTVTDVVLTGRLGLSSPLGPWGRADRVHALRALDRVGLEPLADRLICELSGGQTQRTLIARAIVAEPELLLLDEPLAGVDAAAEEDVYELLQELNRQMTVILVSHDLSLVSRAVRSVLCVHRQVVRHPTTELSDVSGPLLAALYGDQLRLVRHDQHCLEGEEER